MGNTGTNAETGPNGAGKTEERASELGNPVIAQIFALVDKRNYEPGDRLPSERELAERFAVGRGAIREALSTLEAVRYLERRPHSGIFLTKEPDRISLESLVLFADLGLPVDETTNAQCLEVRRLVEIQGVRLACKRRTDADLAALDQILTRFEQAIAEGGHAGDLDYEFHMQMLRATQNDVLVQIVNPFYAMSHSRRTAYFTDIDRTRRSHVQHAQIVDAIRARDADAAAEIVSQHIGRVEEFFLSSFNPGGSSAEDIDP